MYSLEVFFKFVVQLSGFDKKKADNKPIIWGCSSVGRAPALQAGGHGFESHHLHQWDEPKKPNEKNRSVAQVARARA